MQLLKKGFLSLEYAVLIIVTVAAFVTMAAYLRRAICGRWRGVGDGFGYGRQYEPGLTVVTNSGGGP